VDTQQIVALLIAERDRLTQAIAALQGKSSATGIKKSSPKNTRRTRTPEQKAAQAEKMRAYWAARKKTGNKRSNA